MSRRKRAWLPRNRAMPGNPESASLRPRLRSPGHLPAASGWCKDFGGETLFLMVERPEPAARLSRARLTVRLRRPLFLPFAQIAPGPAAGDALHCSLAQRSRSPTALRRCPRSRLRWRVFVFDFVLRADVNLPRTAVQLQRDHFLLKQMHRTCLRAS